MAPIKSAGSKYVVRRAPLTWLMGGLLLGLVQLVAVAVHGPLGVSTQFVVANTQVIESVATDYVRAHPLIQTKKYRDPGYGWWLAVGIVVGAFIAALATGRFRLQHRTVWWELNRGTESGERIVVCFVGGILILLGARFAHGCTSGQFASGWAQLSLSAIPFTIALFAFAMLTAAMFYPKTPKIEK